MLRMIEIAYRNIFGLAELDVQINFLEQGVTSLQATVASLAISCKTAEDDRDSILTKYNELRASISTAMDHTVLRPTTSDIEEK